MSSNFRFWPLDSSKFVMMPFWSEGSSDVKSMFCSIILICMACCDKLVSLIWINPLWRHWSAASCLACFFDLFWACGLIQEKITWRLVSTFHLPSLEDCFGLYLCFQDSHSHKNWTLKYFSIRENLYWMLRWLWKKRKFKKNLNIYEMVGLINN